jgi:3-deoxy-D-manno-octulosonate 8-phosphate phosphatase KdsC-like HAD superfamily phosphatase
MSARTAKKAFVAIARTAWRLGITQMITLKETLYIGNDINDLETMLTVGFPVCPKNAYPEIKKIAKLVIPVSGGDGVIRRLLQYLELKVDSGISDSG